VKAGLVDEKHLVVSSMLLGRVERLFDGLVDIAGAYRRAEFAGSKAAAPYRFVKR
jgi:hypothetical protein